MKKNKVKEIYTSKIKLLKKYNQNYFDENKSLVSDQEYDKLKKEILNLESEYNFLKSKNSPSTNVGFKPQKTLKKYNTEFLCFLFRMHSMRKI